MAVILARPGAAAGRREISVQASPDDALRLYQRASQLAGFGAWECELPSQRLRWTDGVYDLFGLRRGSHVQRSAIVELYEARSRVLMERARAACVQGGTGFQIDCRVSTVGGEERWMRLTGRVEFQHGRPARLYGSKQNVTHEKDLWSGLTDAAALTPVEGFARLERTLSAARTAAPPSRVALAIVEPVDAGLVAERSGGAARRALLRHLHKQLQADFPQAELLARTGDETFALIVGSRLGDRALLRALAVARSRLEAADGEESRHPVAIGVAFVGDGDDAAIARAFAALGLARSLGGGVKLHGEPLSVVDAVDAPLRPV